MMKKHVKKEYFSEHIKILKEAGIMAFCSVIFGYPPETRETIQETLTKIQGAYEIIFNKIYVFEDVNNLDDLMCTYNVDPINLVNFVSNTISIHLKKKTNSLYTINALNAVIRSLNNGVLDKTYQIPWDQFRNCMLVTSEKTGYTKIDTKIYEIVETKKI